MNVLHSSQVEKQIEQAVRRVIKSGVFIGGKEVEAFENAMAAFVNMKYALGVNSGTDGLFLSLKALGIGQGDEVITTPFTFIATAAVIANVGATPVFADINPETFNIEPKEIEKRISKRTRAIIPVHIFGQMADMEAIMHIARKHNLFVIEDAAQAIGATHQKKRAGSMGTTGCYSFFPTKNLGACGDGGMVVTSDKAVAGTIRLLKNHGSLPREKYRNVLWGINSRLDALQAAILHVKLKYLEAWNKKRKERAYYYDSLLASSKEVKTPEIQPHSTHVFHEYTLRVSKRNAVKAFLEKHGIPVAIYYPIPLHLQPALRHMGYQKGDFPEAEKAANEVLSLPLSPSMTKDDQRYVVNKIKLFYLTRKNR